MHSPERLSSWHNYDLLGAQVLRTCPLPKEGSSGLRREIRKKIAPEIAFGLAGKIGKKWLQNRENCPRIGFWGYFPILNFFFVVFFVFLFSLRAGKPRPSPVAGGHVRNSSEAKCRFVGRGDELPMKTLEEQGPGWGIIQRPNMKA